MTTRACATLSASCWSRKGSPVLVADGKAGFERALSVKPDLMIVDLRLPGMNGEIWRAARAALKTPIIVFSAVGEEVDKVLLLRSARMTSA